MKYLIMCEGPNELEIVRMLLEHDKLIFTEDDLLNLVPYHARQIASNPTVKAALNLYHGEVQVLRIGDKLNDELKIPNPKTRLDITSKEVVSSLLICALVAYHTIIDNNVILITPLYDLAWHRVIWNETRFPVTAKMI